LRKTQLARRERIRKQERRVGISRENRKVENEQLQYKVEGKFARQLTRMHAIVAAMRKTD
jgi:CRISPR/Cas system CMR-associated protein Cmr3 (group 5 of RAMP superfamily)